MATTACENSEVFPAGSVAVAVITASPARTAKVTVKRERPLPSVVTRAKPRNFCPWPKPDGSPATLAKNSIRKVVFAVLRSVPRMVTRPPESRAEVKTGKFCNRSGRHGRSEVVRRGPHHRPGQVPQAAVGEDGIAQNGVAGRAVAKDVNAGAVVRRDEVAGPGRRAADGAVSGLRGRR